MIDPAAVATGVATGYITHKGIEKANEILEPERREPQDNIVDLLREILEALAPPEKDSVNETFQLAPYPSEYIISDDFHGRAHVCVFFYGTNIAIRFDGVFGGSYTRNIGPGWFQLDIPGRLSVNGGTTSFLVTVSYRDDALGSSF